MHLIFGQNCRWLVHGINFSRVQYIVRVHCALNCCHDLIGLTVLGLHIGQLPNAHAVLTGHGTFMLKRERVEISGQSLRSGNFF